MIDLHPWVWGVGVGLVVLGCGGEDAPQWVGTLGQAQPAATRPTVSDQSPRDTRPGTATQPRPGPRLATIQVDGRAYTLRATGLGSLAEMRRALSRLTDLQQRSLYRQAFGKTFYYTTEPGSRPYYEAMQAGRDLVRMNPAFAPVLRCVAQDMLHLTGELERPIQVYRMAVKVDPDYAEAHYMLAVLLAMARRRQEGAGHLARARALGLPDYYGLGARFYPTTQP